MNRDDWENRKRDAGTEEMIGRVERETQGRTRMMTVVLRTEMVGRVERETQGPTTMMTVVLITDEQR